MDSIIACLLKKLIMEYNRVSLPCLGSFMSEYVPAYISKGKIYPPSKKILFLQNEIWNDEKLEKLLAVHLDESIGTAKERVAFWIDHVCVLLATGEDVTLPELGKLCISDMSHLLFKQDSDNLLMDSSWLEAIELPFVIEEPPVAVVENNTTGTPLKAMIIITLTFAALAALYLGWHILTGA